MQHGRMMGKPHTERLLYTLHNIFQFMWQRLQTIAECFTSLMKVLSIHLPWEVNAKKKEKEKAFIIRSSDPELELVLSFITYLCESDLLPPFYWLY